MKRSLAVLAILLIPMVPAAGNMEEAATLEYISVTPDPKDDHSGPCPVAGCGTPGTYNKENDILEVAVTDDPTTFVMRFKIQTCDFEVPTGFAFVNVEFGGALSGFEGTVAFDDGCTDLRAIHIDSVTTAAGSDPDKLLPGIRVFADPPTATLYLMADYSDLGLGEGDSISFGRIHTGRQFTDPGRYTFGMDEASAGAFVVGSGWQINAPSDEAAPTEQPTRIVETISSNEARIELPFTNATKTLHIDWALVSGNGTIRIDITGNDSILLNATDAQGNLLFALTGTQDDFRQDIDVEVPLNVTLQLDGFTGNVTMSFTEPGQPEPTSTGSMTSTSTSQSPTPTGGNETTAGEPGEESPGLPMLAVSTAMLALAILRRRQQ